MILNRICSVCPKSGVQLHFKGKTMRFNKAKMSYSVDSASPRDLEDTRSPNMESDEVDRPGEVKDKQKQVTDIPESRPAKSSDDQNKKLDEVPDLAPLKVTPDMGDEIVSPEAKSSLTLFHDEYNTLDVTDYPHPDPGANPDSSSARKVNELDSTDFPLMHRNKLKTKTFIRSRTKKEGIISMHTTYFPEKLSKTQLQEFSPDKVRPDSNYFYDMSSFPRGIFTIFNVEHYHQETGMADYPRKGTERDADALCALFIELGFIVERYDNPTKKAMQNALDSAATNIGSLSCCACAVLTHGEEGILYSSDSSIKIKDITKRFRTKSLAGKPKLFFFQACQGSDYMDAIDAFDGPKKDEDELALPCEADFFYAYSTVPGYYSWRNSRNGSWFMQSLCQVFRQNAHALDLYRMLTRVNDQVSSRKSRTDDRMTDDKRQIAALVSQLRKELFFFPPYGPLVT